MLESINKTQSKAGICQQLLTGEHLLRLGHDGFDSRHGVVGHRSTPVCSNEAIAADIGTDVQLVGLVNLAAITCKSEHYGNQGKNQAKLLAARVRWHGLTHV